MKDSLLKKVKDFLHIHCVPERPLLIGFSGGPDSRALLELLCACRRFFSLDLQVMHIDHSWREESALEAQQLCTYVEGRGLPFHLRTLDPPRGQSNLEDQA